VILVSELLGAVGEFRRWPLVVAMALVATLASALAGRGRASMNVPEAPGNDRASVAIAVIAVTAVASRSLQGALDAWHSGMSSFDTLWYHLPFAARFVQDGSLTGLHYVGNDPTTFYPANGELVHAIGMMLFHSDVLSPVVNVGWLALALLAGWCVGRPYGVAPATMLATCLVAFLPVMGGAQAGTAGTDVAVLALLVSAVALVVNDPGSPARLAVAALAAGLAAGTKLDALAIVVALGILAVVVNRGRGRAVGLQWVAGVALGSVFWYARNLLHVGNPLPWLGGSVGLASTSPPTDCGTTTVTHYLVHPGFVSAHIVPQLPAALGARWWLLLALAAVGTTAALLSRSPLRALALVAVVAAFAYLATPASAGGHEASCFAFNTRFATPALALGLILLPLASSARRLGPLLTVVALAIALALTVHPSHELAAVLGACVLAAGVCFVALGTSRALPRSVAVALVVAVAVVVALAGRHEQRAYARDRYVGTNFSDPVAPIARGLRRVHHARIAVEGLVENYPLYGPDISNRVAYPARPEAAHFLPFTSCHGWLAALSAGGYDYVVTARESSAESPAAAWTRRYPGARELLSSGPGATYRGARWTWQLFQLDPTRRIDLARACASGG
jgi:hypothetical protein